MPRPTLAVSRPALTLVALGLSCASCAPPREVPAGAVALTPGNETVELVDERFLSVALDSTQLVGGRWWSDGDDVDVVDGRAVTEPFDFSRPRLKKLAAALAPGRLRLGGRDADRLVYDVGEPGGGDVPFVPRAGGDDEVQVMTRATWEGAVDFAVELGFELVFTLNAGPSARDEAGAWDPASARALVQLAVERDDPVALWELGNEVNAFGVVHGTALSGEQYARDVAAARALLDDIAPGALLAGPSSAFSPQLGELAPVLPAFLAAGGGTNLDVITWHYYPQQSSRCPLAVVPAEPETLLVPERLDEVDRWAAQVEALRDELAPGAAVWLGETGHARCGGAPGISTTSVSSLWWLDELGLMARRGQKVVVRQALAGADYGLLDDETLDPRPDYWASVLWRAIMGEEVRGVDVGADPSLAIRAYAHCARAGGLAVLALNLDPARPHTIVVEGADGAGAELWLVHADSLLSPTVRLNGEELVDDDGALPGLSPRPAQRADDGRVFVELPPAAYAFLRLPDALCE